MRAWVCSSHFCNCVNAKQAVVGDCSKATNIVSTATCAILPGVDTTSCPAVLYALACTACGPSPVHTEAFRLQWLPIACASSTICAAQSVRYADLLYHCGKHFHDGHAFSAVMPWTVATQQFCKVCKFKAVYLLTKLSCRD